MTKHAFYPLVICASFFLIACQNQEKPATDFLEKFNLGKTIETLNVEQLRPFSAGKASGSNISGTTQRSRHIEIEYTINENGGTPFRESVFTSRLKTAISTELRNSEMNVTGSGSSGDNFHFDYSSGNSIGSVDLKSVRTSKDRFILWCVVRETAGLIGDG